MAGTKRRHAALTLIQRAKLLRAMAENLLNGDGLYYFSKSFYWDAVYRSAWGGKPAINHEILDHKEAEILRLWENPEYRKEGAESAD